MADPQAAAANSAARGAGQEAGSGPSDSVIMSCDLLRIGVFFDGTGNSRAHVSTGDVSWHTNVDLLEEIYTDSGGPEVQMVSGALREVSTFSRYMRGIGVEASGGTTTRGMAWGTGGEGVENRVTQAMDQLLNDIRSKASGMQPCDIWFDAFGFSRGSAAARDFANGVEAGEISYNSSTMRVKFMGLFDTVSSVGSGGNMGNDGAVTLNTRNSADKIVHITAKDEVREYFPLTLAFRETRIQVVGAHSDVGGGYELGTETSTFSYEPSDYPGVRAFYEGRWDVVNNASVAGDTDSVRTTTTPGMIWGTNTETVLTTTSTHGIQFVSLRLMFDRALAANVPFPASLPATIAGTSVSMASDLTGYYDELKAAPYRASADTEKTIRRKYAHFSTNNDSTWGVHPNLPETNGRRRVSRM